MNDHAEFADHELVRRFAAARAADDGDGMDEVLAQVPEAQLDTFFAALDEAVEAGQHEFDGELLHSALRSAGFAADDALRLSLLAEGELGAYLAAGIRATGRDIHAVAGSVVGELADLDSDARPVVERYLVRILDGRHDVRRVTDRALAAVASACGASLSACEQLRDRVSAAGTPTPGLLAARGNDGAGGAEVAGAADDLVDELFTGRQI